MGCLRENLGPPFLLHFSLLAFFLGNLSCINSLVKVKILCFLIALMFEGQLVKIRLYVKATH